MIFNDIIQTLLTGSARLGAGGIVVLIGCNKGVHRCTVAAMTLVAMMNSIVHGGHKLFNANHLRMEAEHPEKALYSGYRWAFEHAWKLFGLPVSRYAEDVASDSAAMQDNFDGIWKIVEEVNGGLAYAQDILRLARRVYDAPASEAEEEVTPPVPKKRPRVSPSVADVVRPSSSVSCSSTDGLAAAFLARDAARTHVPQAHVVKV